MRALLLAVGLLVASPLPPVADAGPLGGLLARRFHYQTIETAHFIVHFDAPLLPIARRVATVAEHARARVNAELGHVPAGKTHIVVRDETDSANGFAYTIPRNAITVYATAPTTDSDLADYDDWLALLVAHEYAHIVHLDMDAVLPRIFNSIFGKRWAPNQVQPRWIIEGIATYLESKLSSAGRLRNSRFLMYLRTATLTGERLRLDEVSGAPLRFPRGTAAYLYGAHFLHYIFTKTGDAALPKMAHAYAKGLVPFSINASIVAGTGRDFPSWYREWTAFLEGKSALEAEAVRRRGVVEGENLTTNGEFYGAPQYDPVDGSLYFIGTDGYSAVRLFRREAAPLGPVAAPAALQDIMRADGVTNYAVRNGRVIFDLARQFDVDGSFLDLHARAGQGGKLERLTTGLRARDPSVSHDGKWVAMTIGGADQAHIAIMPLGEPGAAARMVYRSAAHEVATKPAWSPDDTRLAMSVWRPGGARDIVVIDAKGAGVVAQITADRAVDIDPVWSPDGAYLYFVSDRSGISNVYAYQWSDGALWQVTNVIGGAYAPTIHQSGTKLAYQGFVGGGYDVFELALEPARFLPAQPYIDARPPTNLAQDGDVAISRPSDYRPLQTLAPQNWRLEVQGGSESQLFNLETSGGDVAGVHAFVLGASFELGSRQASVAASYNNRALKLPWSLSASRRHIVRQDLPFYGTTYSYEQEVLSGRLGVSIPFDNPAYASWSVGLDYSGDWVRRVRGGAPPPDPQQPIPPRVEDAQQFAGLGVRAGFSNVRSDRLSLGPQRGFDASMSVRVEDPAIGSETQSATLSWLARGYWDLPFGETPTLAVRVGGGVRFAQGPAATYALGSNPEQDLVQAILDGSRVGTTGFLRGYASRAFTGKQYHLVNLEYRQRVVDLERGLSTVPFYLRRLHGALLLDAGGTLQSPEALPARETFGLGFGGALRLDTLWGYGLPITVEVGVARGLTSKGLTETWVSLTGSI